MKAVPSVCRWLSEGVSLARDMAMTFGLLREVEEARWVEGPAGLIARLRERGMKTETRSAWEKRRLASVIVRLDRVVMGGPNCYRRSLVRIAMDRDAASEPFVLGLNLPDDKPRGHAWVEGAGEGSERYDVEFRL